MHTRRHWNAYIVSLSATSCTQFVTDAAMKKLKKCLLETTGWVEATNPYLRVTTKHEKQIDDRRCHCNTMQTTWETTVLILWVFILICNIASLKNFFERGQINLEQGDSRVMITRHTRHPTIQDSHVQSTCDDGQSWRNTSVSPSGVNNLSVQMYAHGVQCLRECLQTETLKLI